MGSGMNDTNGASLKPFQLVKFFSFTGLVVFLVSTLALSWVISRYAKRALLDQSEDYAFVLAENLNHQVFHQFVLPTVLRYGRIGLRNPSQFARLDTIVRNTIHGMNIRSVTIFDSQENIVSYSMLSERVGKKGIGGREYEKARKGESNSTLYSNGSLLNLFPGVEPISCQLKTYIPFRQEKPLSQSTDLVMGVIEIVQDLSGDLEVIIKLQGAIIATSVVIMSTLFVVLWFIVARADQIIEERARERRRLEEKLNHAERLAALGEMVASVSHEIKNPLGIVQSTADILKKRLKEAAPDNEHLAAIIIEETGRLDGIVREFLDFARPQVPKVTAVSVNEILSKAVKFMKPELDKNKISLDLHLTDSITTVEADPDQLYRAYLNVLINGVQAMPDGGMLTVETRSLVAGRESFVVSEIRDTGIGIPQEKQKQIFNPFVTDKNRGTGLGLAIVKNIVDTHKGTIAVESEEGKGAEFIITLKKAGM